MEIRVAVLADQASTDAEGLLSLHRTIDRFIASNAPVRSAPFFLVIQMAFEPSEAGVKELTVVLQDEDGNEIIPPYQRTFDAPRSPGGAMTVVTPLLQFGSVTFPRLGNYQFILLLNGRVERAIRFYVG